MLGLGTGERVAAAPSFRLTTCGCRNGIGQKKGASEFTSPQILRLGFGYPPAAFTLAAIAGITTFTLICFGLVSSRFGTCNVSAPL